MMLATPIRKLLLTVHVATSVGFIGAVAAFLALAVAGLVDPSQQAVYRVLPLVTWDVVVPFAVAALLLGIVQSLLTPWGLVRHYWLLVKLVLSTVALVVLLLQTGTIDGLGRAAQGAGFAPGDLMEARLALVVHSAGGLVVLLAATALSVYKPRGLTPWGARSAPEPAA